MEALNSLLPLLLYCFGIILLVVLIILGIKLIMILDKVDNVIDKVDEKVSALDGLFTFIDNASNSLTLMGDTIINGISGIIMKIFKKKNKNDKEDFDE